MASRLSGSWSVPHGGGFEAVFDEGQRLGFVQRIKSLDNAGLYGPAAVELLFELLQCR